MHSEPYRLPALSYTCSAITTTSTTITGNTRLLECVQLVYLQMQILIQYPRI